MEWGFPCVRRVKGRKYMRKRYAEPKSGTLCLHRKRPPYDAQSEIEHNRKKIEKSKGRWDEHVGFCEANAIAFV